MTAPALRVVTPDATPPAAPTMAEVLATYTAQADRLERARAKLAQMETDAQQAARAVYVAAAGHRVLIAGDSVVYVDGTGANPVIRVVQATVIR